MFGVSVFVFALLSSFVLILEVFYFIFSCPGFEPVGFFIDCSLGIKDMMLQHKQKESDPMF